MLSYLYSLLSRTPWEIIQNIQSVDGIVFAVVVLLMAFSRPLAEKLHTQWTGVGLRWPIGLLGLLCLWSFVGVAYRDFEGAQERAERAEQGQVRAEAELAAERDAPARKRLIQVEEGLARMNRPRALSGAAIDKLKSELRNVQQPYLVHLVGWAEMSEASTLVRQFDEVFKALGWETLTAWGMTPIVSGTQVEATQQDCDTAKSIAKILADDGLQTGPAICWENPKTGDWPKTWQRVWIRIGLPDPTYLSPSDSERK